MMDDPARDRDTALEGLARRIARDPAEHHEPGVALCADEMRRLGLGREAVARLKLQLRSLVRRFAEEGA